MGYAVARQIENRFKNVENRLEDLVFRGARGRMAHLLVALAEQFGEAQPGRADRQGTTELNLPLTQQDLASMIGISRPTASIAFNELEKAGYVGREGRRIFVADLERLRADADHL
jgi:CRP/FNR family transcriptional regulator